MTQPITIHAGNPHYFAFNDQPAVLLASAEHYGAVLNAAFDYKAYLGELKACGNNLTRVFAGIYREEPGVFYLKYNTLAPLPVDFLCPFRRSEVPGASDGLNKFDLDAWDPRFFERLGAFMQEAASQDIVVELAFFCPFYRESQGDRLWNLSPFHPDNNVNGVGSAGCEAVFVWKDEKFVKYQSAMVRKLVEFLNPYDNLMFEIMNEPYISNVATAEFQRAISKIVTDTERNLPKKHLITQNIANGSMKIEDPDPLVSVFNFHYATPPRAVEENFSLNKPIGCNETGFAKNNLDSTFRRQAWEFMLAGGALFNNLDFSFAVGNERGAGESQCEHTGGSHTLRSQLGFLRRFMQEMDFTRMRPANKLIDALDPAARNGYLLAEPGRQYAFYLAKDELPDAAGFEVEAGAYRYELIDPARCLLVEEGTFAHPGGSWSASLSQIKQAKVSEIAIKVVRTA